MFKKHNSIFNNSKQRWSLRKMSVGLTSVLLGFIFLSGSQTAKADTVSSSEVEQSSAVLVQDKQANNQNTNVDIDGGKVTSAKQDDGAKNVAKTTVANTKPESQQSSISATNEQKSTTTTLNVNDAQPQSTGISLYESKLQGSGTDSKEDVTKNDQEKAKQLTTENINQHILDKYQKMLDESSQGSWINGLPTHKQQETAEVKNGTKILVDNPGWGPKPLVNNTIIYKGKKYKYIYQNNNGDTDEVSSVYGLATTSTGDDWIDPMRGFNFSNSSAEDINEDYGYRWTKTKDGNIIIKHDTNREEKIVNEGGHQWDIDKDDGHVIIKDTDDDSDEEIDDNYKEFDTDLDIQESLILTPEGNIVHKVTFINEGNENGEPIPLSYYALIDTSMNGKDGAPIYVTANGSLYISNNGMVYGIRKLGDGRILATNNDSARINDSDNLSEDIDAAYGAEHMDTQTPLISDVDDTAIRVTTPVVTLNQGDSVDMWYIETAFPLSALKGKSIGEAVDDQINLPVNEWIKELEDQEKKDQEDQNKSDQFWGPESKHNADVTKHNSNDDIKKYGDKYKDNWEDSVEDSTEYENKDNPIKIGWDKLKNTFTIDNLKNTFTIDNLKNNWKNVLNKLNPKNNWQNFKNEFQNLLDKMTPKNLVEKLSSMYSSFKEGKYKKADYFKGLGKIIGVLGKEEDLKEQLHNWFELRESVESRIDSYHESIRKEIQKLEKDISTVPHSVNKLGLAVIGENIREYKKKLSNNISSAYSKAKENIQKAEKKFFGFFRDNIAEDGEDTIIHLVSKGVIAGVCLLFPEAVAFEQPLEGELAIVLTASLNLVKEKHVQGVKNEIDKPVKNIFNIIWNGVSINNNNYGLRAFCDCINKVIISDSNKVSDRINNVIDIKKYLNK